jgi:branched-chain amino acid transport system permease protein
MIGVISYGAFFLTIALILGIAVLGLNLQWGAAGIFNGGVAAFFGAGAYGLLLAGGPAREGFGGFGLPWPVAMLAGVALSGLLALGVGLLTARLRHDYFAIATFGVSVAIEALARNAQWLMGGAMGLRGFPRPFEATAGDPFLWTLGFLALVMACTAAVYAGLERILRAPFGRMLRAIREDETAARALGKSPARARLEAFVLGAMIMGLAGALYGTFYAFVSPQDIAPILTFQIWAMLIVGGAGNNAGALLGALVVWGGWTLSGWLLAAFAPQGWQLYAGTVQFILIGLVIVGMLLWRPRGLIPERLTVSTAAAARPTTPIPTGETA